MDPLIAAEILLEEVGKLRARSYAELVATIGEPELREVTGSDGKQYQLETGCHWDSADGGNVRVITSVDDGKLTDIAPLIDDFIKAPDGSFVGE